MRLQQFRASVRRAVQVYAGARAERPARLVLVPRLEELEPRTLLTGPAPTGVVVIPDHGNIGQLITINGQNLTGADQVDFGVTQVTAGIAVNNAGNSLTVTVPTLVFGTYEVIVVTPGGQSTTSPTTQFTVGPAVQFVGPSGGPTAGGTLVTIRGANLDGATAVNFGATQVTTGIVVDSLGATVTVTSPPLAFGTYDVTVTTPGGTSLTSNADKFTAGPTVTGISPSSGGTNVTISGGDLSGATQVNFGTTVVPSSQFTSASGSSITVPVPSGLAQGVYDVTVTTPHGTSPTSSVDQYLAQPIAFTFANNTGLSASVPIYVAIAGQIALDPQGNVDPIGNGPNDTFPFVYLNAAGQYTFTAPLYIGHAAPNFNYVPTFQVPFNAQGNAVVNLPHIYMDSFRIVIGVGQAPKEPIDAANGAIAAPSLSNPSDPNQQTFVDFVEYTLNQKDQLYIDTTLVDQFGVPITLQVNPPDGNPALQGGVGVEVSRPLVFNAFTNYLTLVNAGSAFDALATTAGSGNLDGASYPYRILSPKDFVQQNELAATPGSSPLNTYFDTSLIDFYTKYSASGASLILNVPNPNYGVNGNMLNPNDPASYTFVGQTKEIRGNTYTVIEFSDPTVTGGGNLYPDGTQNNAVFDVYAPFFSTNGDNTTFPTSAPFPATLPPFPSFSGGSLPGNTEWPSEMVWSNDGVFADNTYQFNASADDATSSNSNLQSNLLANIENQIASALSRGIANLNVPAGETATAYWTAPSTPYYAVGSTANFYAGFWHQANEDGSLGSAGYPVSIGRFAYAFPYDDQGNNSSTIVSTNPQTVSITLGAFQLGQPGTADNTNSLFVTNLYEQFLDRAPEASGLNYWVGLLNSGAASKQVVAQEILASPERRGVQVDSYYELYLNRAADPAGRAAWVQQMLAGVSDITVQVDFITSPEYTAAHPDVASFVDSLYLEILNRPADPAGAQAWESIAAQPGGRARVAAGILGSGEHDVDLIDQFYGTILGRAPDPGGLSYFLGLLLSNEKTPDQEEVLILTSQEALARL
ncbi:MAG TPA: DUF4214 domain-containing protein [Gemmataceae bacterium]|nr:DUF4214 domain-containing protein [Gemmataceae bacterium]